LSGWLAGIILFLTVSTSFVLGILAAYGAVAGIIFLFAHQSKAVAVMVPEPAKAMRAAASQASGD
jgi:hypothetical protein